RHGAEVIIQPGRVRSYDGSILEMRNIIGQYRPDHRERVMLFAHWDTRPFADKDTLRQREPIDGANDGGSGVGVLLEIARILGNDTTLDLGVDIILFDAEDYGTPEWGERNQNSALTWCLGSQFWAGQPHRVGYRAKYGILLDMVGAEGAVFNREGTSMAYAPDVVQRIWNAAEQLGFGNYFKTDVTPETIDDNLFVSEFAGIPSANIVHYQVQVLPMGYGPFHHTHADNMSIISRETLDAVGSTVLDVLWND
ncbi:MAG: M28 family peptidase, partial [Flavobacteriales bacterium]